jgi:NADH-quinone oxidoreductase subunit H
METASSLGMYLRELTGSTASIWFWYGIAVSLVLFLFVLPFASLATWVERKLSADFQSRIGPNRVGPWGLFQFIADALKLIGKEDIIPSAADKKLFLLAPVITILGFFLAWIPIPFSPNFVVSDLDVGVFYVVAVTGLVGIGGLMAGYSSNNKWSMLGGLRVSAQSVSYEIPILVGILSIVLLSGSMNFNEIIRAQGVWPWDWYLFYNPFTFILFFTVFIAQVAEIHRVPFDLPEGESELVAGNLTEYSGMRYGLFQLAEFGEQALVGAVMAALFMGGWQIPINYSEWGIMGDVLSSFVFILKIFVLWFVLIWFRWTYPRLRVDQLMRLTWHYLTPIGFFCLLGNAVWMVVTKNQSVIDLIFR